MVSFKEIDILGFKSFADHTNIKFDGGITAIVGPNGCGKSNVSDAIRWVLGEQRGKSLRGNSMQDVIFAGTEKRKRLSYCEVSIVFDNTKKWFNSEHDEIKITRKLYRSGESEYLINDKTCRLKDITDILYDSGIGRDGYSFIGQGKVEEIISSKPEDRRTIFEDAAGISKFKARKVESERRLEHTRDNINRLNDILSEVSRRLGPLKKQSEDAKLYLGYRDSLKDLEINAYVYSYENASTQKEEITIRKQGFQDNLKMRQNELDNLQIRYERNMTEISRVDMQLNNLHDEILALNIDLEKRQGESNLYNERMKFISEQRDKLVHSLSELNNDILDKKESYNTSLKKREELENKLVELRAKSDKLQDEYLQIVDSITISEEKVQENQKAMFENLSKLTDIKSNLSSMFAKRDSLNQLGVSLQEKKKSLIENISQVESELNAEKEKLSSVKEKLTSLESTMSSNKSKLSAEENDLNDLNNRIYSLKTSITNDINRKNILVNLQQDYEGYQYAVKRLLQDSKKDSALNRSIKGVIGNIITVKEMYQTAIEVALGASIQYVVTSNEDDAKLLISYLKEAKLGRATFLPMTSIKPRSLSKQDEKYLSYKGVLGVASDLVDFDEKFRTIINSLLGTTVIVDNLDNAVAVARVSGFSFKIVTLEGDVLNPQGSMSGGSKKAKESSLLSKDAEIKSLEANIEKNKSILQNMELDYDKTKVTITKLKELIDGLNYSLQDTNAEYSSANTKMQAIQKNLDYLNQDYKALEIDINNNTYILKELNEKISSVGSIETDIAEKREAADINIQSRESMYSELKKKRESYNDEMTKLKVEIASSEQLLQSLIYDIDRFKGEIDEKSHLVEVQNSDLEKINNNIEMLNSSIKEITNDADTQAIKEKLEKKQAELGSFDEHKKAIMHEIDDIKVDRETLMEDVTRLNNRIYQEETKLQKVDLDLESMQEKIYEEYKLTYSECKPFAKEEFDYKEGMIEISKLKSKINALGYINVSAIDEYASEGARFEEMSTQMDDLKKSEEDLVKIINDLSTEMVTKFNTEFTKINENFTKVFKELFGGGNARLELLESEDPLQAGVEIIAQPPGKSLRTITLMSGGEKAMTAIAILFAILRLKPMPFCLLDEIEAALDDANVDRYASYLQRFSEVTQFIVITHRKPTMERADNLYGVTMEEKGVSKVVSVKLADAVKNSSEEQK